MKEIMEEKDKIELIENFFKKHNFKFTGEKLYSSRLVYLESCLTQLSSLLDYRYIEDFIEELNLKYPHDKITKRKIITIDGKRAFEIMKDTIKVSNINPECFKLLSEIQELAKEYKL